VPPSALDAASAVDRIAARELDDHKNQKADDNQNEKRVNEALEQIFAEIH